MFCKFTEKAIREYYPPNARLAYYTLLGEFYRDKYHQEKLRMTLRDFGAISGIKQATLQIAIVYLDEHNDIVREVTPKGTYYSFPEDK